MLYTTHGPQQHFAPPELREFTNAVFYKHLVPTGLTLVLGDGLREQQRHEHPTFS